MQTAQETGRRGGLERARRLTPERLSAIAREAAMVRHHGGVSTRQLFRRFIARIGEEDEKLALWIQSALFAPGQIAPAVLETLGRELTEESSELALRALDEVLAELPQNRNGGRQ